MLIVFPPFQRIPVKGYGPIEKVAYERGWELTKLGYDVDAIVPTGSIVQYAQKVYYIPRLSLRFTGRDIFNVKDPFGVFIQYLRLLRDSHAFGYWRIYSTAIQESCIPEEYDVIINDAFRTEIRNLFSFGKIFMSEKTLHMLHAIPSSIIKLPVRLPFRGMFGVLNTQAYKIFRSLGYKAFYLPNGVHVPANRRPIDPEDYLVWLGRITFAKGAHLAIKIARRVKRRLVLIGPVQDERYFDVYVKPYVDGRNIIYAGHVTNEVKEDLLGKSLALVYASLFPDNLPTVALEALSLGVPIFGLAPPSPSGFYDVCNEECGVFAKNVETLATNISLLERMDRKRILEWTINNWSWESVIRKHYEPVFQILNKI